MLVLAAAAAVVATACGSAPPGAGPATHPETVAPREADSGGRVDFVDPEVGLAGRHPAGWHRARALTGVLVPREVLALASYPLREGATAGECAPSTAREDMPPGGAFIWLIEYRPLLGGVWADLPRDRFPPRPERFDLRAEDLVESVSCFDGPGYSTAFRAADRPFQLLVAFGGEQTAERLAEVNAILDSLAFAELPPPPPDPYAGWPLINDNPGDSIRVPTGWAAAAAMFPPGETPRPRPLFFASSVPLAGLPARLVPHVEALPAPFPAEALEDFPAAAVLLWVVEEEPGGVSRDFPQIGREWPTGEDFTPTPPTVAPHLRWQRAGGSWQGYRFSVWIAAGPDAPARDVELAVQSGASLAVSGCGRDGDLDCLDDG